MTADSGITRDADGVPFHRVWRAVETALAASGRWTVEHADPVGGRIVALSRSRLPGGRTRAEIEVRLDDYGLTRLTVTCASRGGRRRPRAERRLLRLLTRTLRAPPTR